MSRIVGFRSRYDPHSVRVEVADSERHQHLELRGELGWIDRVNPSRLKDRHSIY